MRPIATDGIVWSVGLSVSLSVIIVSRARTAEPIDMLFTMWTRVGPANHMLDGGPDVHVWRGILRSIGGGGSRTSPDVSGSWYT